MTDTRSIDRFFDAVDGIIGKVDRGLNGVKQIEDEAPRSKRSAKSKAARSAPSTSTALAARRFRIDEVTDATTGAVLFIVTDGATARCEFNSRATAEKILAQLESSP